MFENHFSLSEFFAGCSPQEIHEALKSSIVVDNLIYWSAFLDNLRKDISSINMKDTPIYINSCYRDKYHNARCKDSSPTSQHLEAGAVDICTCSHADIDNIIYAIKKYYPYGQLIIYDTFVHVSRIRANKANFVVLDKRNQ